MSHNKLFSLTWVFLPCIPVLTAPLQGVQNDSTIAPSVTSYQQMLTTVSTSPSSSLSPESPTENKEASNLDNQEREETEAPLLIELWKIISIGGLLIVFILLIFILGLLVSQMKTDITQATQRHCSTLSLWWINTSTRFNLIIIV